MMFIYLLRVSGKDDALFYDFIKSAGLDPTPGIRPSLIKLAIETPR